MIHFFPVVGWPSRRAAEIIGGMDDKINLADKLAVFPDYWSPRTVARLNDFDVMVVRGPRANLSGTSTMRPMICFLF